MHTRVVYQGCLVDVDVEAVVGLELQGGLHSGGAEELVGGVALGHLVGHGRNLREAADVVAVFLGVVVSGYPVCGMVAGHRELGEFLADHEIDQIGLLGEFVAEAEAVVINAEAHYHMHSVVVEGDGEFVVVVAYVGFLSPDRGPGLVETGALDILEAEAGLHVHGVAVALGLVFHCPASAYPLAAEGESQLAGGYDLAVAVFEAVGGDAFCAEREIKFDVAVGAGGRNAFAVLLAAGAEGRGGDGQGY